MEFHKIWVEQCRAAEGLKEDRGTEKALGYLVGEKLVNFLRAAKTYPKFAAEVPDFVAEVKHIFEPHELRGYLTGVYRAEATLAPTALGLSAPSARGPFGAKRCWGGRGRR